MDAVTHVPAPANEPVLDYAPGSPERAALEAALVELGSSQRELPHTIDGKRVTGSGDAIEVRQPHAHAVGAPCIQLHDGSRAERRACRARADSGYQLQTRAWPHCVPVLCCCACCGESAQRVFSLSLAVM